MTNPPCILADLRRSDIDPNDSLWNNVPQIRRDFDLALQYTIRHIENEERKRSDTYAIIHPLTAAWLVGEPTDAPALADLVRLAWQVGGEGVQKVEETALKALVEVVDSDDVGFLQACFQYSRPRDSMAGRRRAIVMLGAAAAACLHNDEGAWNLVMSGTAHKIQEVRRGVCEAAIDLQFSLDERTPTRLSEIIQPLESDPDISVQYLAKCFFRGEDPGFM
jgi:hypothetical protein